MGEVYRATDTNLKRAVAIKVLPSSLAADPERLARFQREAEVLASLNHPNIAAIYGLERSEGSSALVMELVEGPTLADRIALGAVPIDEALPIARQIADALEAAHEQGIIHRDLKPANVKVRSDGAVKVLDFGLAKAMEPAAGSVAGVSQAPTVTTPALVTGVGVILGTAAYMSPEQARGQAADRRSDIWSFGCVLFEMLTGKRAFGGEDVIDTLAEVRRAEPDWAALPAAMPASVHRLLRRCLTKDRKARLADASSLRIEIDDARTASEEAAPHARSHGFRFERAAWVTGVLALALVAAYAIRAALRPDAVAPEVRFDIEVPIGANNALAVSPDGRLVALVATEQVWIYPTDGRPARALDGTKGAIAAVFWSPDSRSVGFFAEKNLKRVDVETGAVQTLAEAPGGLGGAWSRNGVIVFAPTRGPLFRVSQAGGAVASITTVEGPEVRHVSPQFLPDGRHYLFFSGGNPRVRGLYVADLDGTEPPRRLLEDAEGSGVHAAGHLLFPRRGALMAHRFDAASLTLIGEPQQVAEGVAVDRTQGRTSLSASETGVIVYRKPDAQTVARKMMWVDRAGRVLEEIEFDDGFSGQHPALSPNGRTLALSASAVATPGGGIYLVELGRGIRTRFASGNDASFPLWSRDGTELLFTTLRSGIRDLYRQPLSGGEAELFFSTSGSKAAHDWSPDGRYLLYRDVNPRTGYDLLALPVEQGGPGTAVRVRTGEQPVPIAVTAAGEANGQFSPDGRWVAFESDESGEREVYVQPFGRPGAKQRVSPQGGTQVRWSADGQELFYIAPDERLSAVTVRRANDGSSIELGAPVPLFMLRTRNISTASQEYVVAQNGQRFLVNTVTDSRATVSVVVNWQP